MVSSCLFKFKGLQVCKFFVCIGLRDSSLGKKKGVMEMALQYLSLTLQAAYVLEDLTPENHNLGR